VSGRGRVTALIRLVAHMGWRGPALILRLGRDRSRGARPNDSVVIQEPWGTWAAAGPAHKPGFLAVAARLANGAIYRDHTSVSCTRANAPVQLRAVGPICALPPMMRRS